MHCLYCHSDDHPWFNCRKRPEGWKPPKPIRIKTVVDGDFTFIAALDPVPASALAGNIYAKLGRPRSIKPSEGKSKLAADA